MDTPETSEKARGQSLSANNSFLAQFPGIAAAMKAWETRHQQDSQLNASPTIPYHDFIPIEEPSVLDCEEDNSGPEHSQANLTEFIAHTGEEVVDVDENTLHSQQINAVGTDDEADHLSDVDPEEVEVIWDQVEEFYNEKEAEITAKAVLESMNTRNVRIAAMEAERKLSQEDVDWIRSLAYHQRHRGTEESWSDLGQLFPGRVILPSLHLAQKHLKDLSNLHDQVFHCCVNSCCCFTGPFADAVVCPICSEPRLDEYNKPRNIFRYLPLIPRLKAFF